MRETVYVVATIALMATALVLMWKYRREYLRVVAYYAVIQAEEYYNSKKGREKLEFAVARVKAKLPWWIAWMISEKAIRYAIEGCLDNLQLVFKEAKVKQLAVLDNVMTFGASPENLKKLNNDINTKGYVEGYVQGRTDFHGDSQAEVGVRGGVKF